MTTHWYPAADLDQPDPALLEAEIPPLLAPETDGDRRQRHKALGSLAAMAAMTVTYALTFEQLATVIDGAFAAPGSRDSEAGERATVFLTIGSVASVLLWVLGLVLAALALNRARHRPTLPSGVKGCSATAIALGCTVPPLYPVARIVVWYLSGVS